MNSRIGNQFLQAATGLPELPRRRHCYWLPALIIICGSGLSGAFADDGAAGLRVCVANYHQGYFGEEFEDGPVTVPTGSVFEFNGYIMSGNLQDPEDDAHKDETATRVTWSGVTGGEQMRRTVMLDRYAREKLSADTGWSAVATTSPATVTKSQPCATVPAKIVISKDNHWTITTLPADETRYYSLVGSVKEGAFDQNAWDENDDRGHAEYYASVRGAVTETLTLIAGHGRRQ